MKHRLDIDALLAKNPRVNQTEIRRVLKSDDGFEPAKLLGIPYGGRRLVIDDRAKMEDGSVKRLRSYRAA